MLAAAVLAVLRASAANAEAGGSDSSSDAGPSLEAIVVTAERRSENIQTVPVAVTALSGETLAKFDDESFGDYAHLIPNLSFGTGGDFGVTNGRSVAIRGIAGGTFREGLATTSFYIDDTPVPQSLDPHVLDLERVEVLRGPQGTLFGSSAMGGTVRIITKAADATAVSGFVDAQAFDIHFGGVGYDVSGGANLPLISDELALKMAVFSEYRPGIYTREYGIATTPGFTVPASQPVSSESHSGADQEYGGIVALLYTPAAAPGLTVQPMVIYQNERTNGMPLSDFSPSDLVQVRPLDVAESTVDNWSFAALTVKYRQDYGTFIASSSTFHEVAHDNEDGTEPIVTQFGQNYLFPPLSSTYAAAPSPTYIDYTQGTEEVRFESSFAGPLQAIVGGYYNHGTTRNGESITDPDVDYEGEFAFINQQSQANNEVAAFADLAYKPIAPLELSAGVRYSRLHFLYFNYSNGWANGGESSTVETHDEHPVTPRYAIKYQIDPNAMIYASAAKGFRNGGANPAAADVYCATNASEFKSDSLWSYELGAKNTLFDGRINTRLAVYRIDWNDLQQRVLLTCGYSVTENAGSATSTGGEFEADIAPLRGLDLSVSLGYDNAKITSVPGGAAGFINGQSLSGIPKVTASLLGQYSVPTSFGSAFLRSQYSFTGSSFSYTVVPSQEGGRERASYSLVDLHAGGVTGPWETSLFVKNLFDVRANLGDELSETAELTNPPRPRWLIAQPRTIGLEVKWRFKDHRPQTLHPARCRGRAAPR